jgi:hypothetical protein
VRREALEPARQNVVPDLRRRLSVGFVEVEGLAEPPLPRKEWLSLAPNEKEGKTC